MKKLDYLESLRGIAAFTVVISHFVVGFYPALFWGKQSQVHAASDIEIVLSGTPLHLLYNGTFSVAIFFVLSGFVLTYKFFKDANTRVALLPIAGKRYTRLFLPVIFSNIIAYLFLVFSLYENQPAAALTRSEWLGSYWLFDPSFTTMLYESFIGAFFTKRVTYNGVLWTMTYELFGSMIVYGFISLVGRHPKRTWAYIIAFLLFRRSYYLAFILGMLLSDIVTREENLFKTISHKGYFIAILLLGLFFGSIPSARPLEGTIYSLLGRMANPRTWYIIGATLIMIALLNSNRLQKLLSRRPFVFLGKISFSLYLLHQLVIGTVSSSLLLAITPALSYHAACAVTFIVTILVIFVASYFMYLFVDAKGIEASQAVHRIIIGWMRSFTNMLRRYFPAPVANSRLTATLFYPGGPPASPTAKEGA